MNNSDKDSVIVKQPKIVDLSLQLEDGMITYPTPAHQRFESSIIGRAEVEGRETRKFTMGSHCGTHVDAMRHFIKDGLTIDQIPVNQLIGPALLVNLGSLEPSAIIEFHHLPSILKSNRVERLVLRTDWSRFWNTKQYYTEWPCLSEKCTHALVEAGVKLLAIDFPSPDAAYFGDDCSLDCPNHKIFFSHEIVLVEYLNNLSSLNEGNIFLMVAPLKLMRFDGAPARVTAYSIELE